MLKGFDCPKGFQRVDEHFPGAAVFGRAATGAGVSVHKQLNEEDLSPWIQAMSLLPLSLLSNNGKAIEGTVWVFNPQTPQPSDAIFGP